ncbi:MAG: hypothetical protein HS103_07090 [Anaerolineales bacterium]|nr:hypothetical protein [Anaerolineales bacterium]
MPRSGMATVIAQLRLLTNTTPTDVTLAGVPYWTDDQLQAELDRMATVHSRLGLIAVTPPPVTVYRIPLSDPLEEAGTDSGFAVRDRRGAVVNPALYAVNYAARRITFLSETGGARYVLDCRVYNLHRAAAAVWAQKAALAAAKLDWEAEGRGVRAAQEHAHCLRMVDHHERLAGIVVGRFV